MITYLHVRQPDLEYIATILVRVESHMFNQWIGTWRLVRSQVGTLCPGGWGRKARRCCDSRARHFKALIGPSHTPST